MTGLYMYMYILLLIIYLLLYYTVQLRITTILLYKFDFKKRINLFLKNKFNLMEIDYNIRVRIIETKLIPNSINSYIYKIKRAI